MSQSPAQALREALENAKNLSSSGENGGAYHFIQRAEELLDVALAPPAETPSPEPDLSDDEAIALAMEHGSAGVMLPSQRRAAINRGREAWGRLLAVRRKAETQAVQGEPAASGVQPSAEPLLPPRPGDPFDASARLVRYGRTGPRSNVLFVPMADGYWTPWHIAQAALDAAHPAPAEQEGVREALKEWLPIFAGSGHFVSAEAHADFMRQVSEFVDAEAGTRAALAKPAATEGRAPDAGWISVEDRLPERYRAGAQFSADVLVCDMTRKWPIVHTSSCHWFEGQEPVWRGADVTHWMPLPAPPAGQSEGGKS